MSETYQTHSEWVQAVVDSVHGEDCPHCGDEIDVITSESVHATFHLGPGDASTERDWRLTLYCPACTKRLHVGGDPK